MTPVHLRAAVEVINSLRISIGLCWAYSSSAGANSCHRLRPVALGWFAAGIGGWFS